MLKSLLVRWLPWLARRAKPRPFASRTIRHSVSPRPSLPVTPRAVCAWPRRSIPGCATSTVRRFMTRHRCRLAESRTAAMAASEAKPRSRNSPICAGSPSRPGRDTTRSNLARYLERNSMAASSPYRADHVGSFLRPAELLEARRSGAAPEQLHALEDKHILRALKKQKEL